jgi:hypothetical protein
MSMRSLLGAAILATVVSALCLGGSPEDQVAADVKALQAELEAMKGQGPKGVLDKLASWKFELLAAWKTDDPASQDFKKLNKGKTRFSKKEIAELLGPAGTYKIATYGLLIGTESATTGTIDDFGRGVYKDASYSVRIYRAIRITFRDDKLIDVQSWPRVESSQVAGGTWLQR